MIKIYHFNKIKCMIRYSYVKEAESTDDILIENLIAELKGRII